MRYFLPLILIYFSAPCFSQTPEYSIRDLKADEFKEDKSYIYLLPFEKGKKVFLIQAYESKMSHKGERALDFKIKKGTKICAAREGVVKHIDGSVAHYWHLKKDGVHVNVGDPVIAGQLIGESGNTGYSAFPHLHFEVVGNDANGNYTQLATRFKTKKGIKYLRPAKFYRSVR
jgi:murein DD-endopeptidase MepM/ murein hydrolase activator NlpD